MKIITGIWVALFVFTLGVSLYFTSMTIKGALLYTKYSQSVPAKIYQWEILDDSKGNFFLKAYFKYQFADQGYSGETAFYQKKFLNVKAAELVMRDWAKESWLAWVNPSHKSESTLVRSLPFNSFFRALLSMGVLVYLSFARKKIKKYLLQM